MVPLSSATTSPSSIHEKRATARAIMCIESVAMDRMVSMFQKRQMDPCMSKRVSSSLVSFDYLCAVWQWIDIDDFDIFRDEDIVEAIDKKPRAVEVGIVGKVRFGTKVAEVRTLKRFFQLGSPISDAVKTRKSLVRRRDRSSRHQMIRRIPLLHVKVTCKSNIRNCFPKNGGQRGCYHPKSERI